MKSDKLSSFALIIAAIILLVVGAISYRDYLKAKYEKEFGVPAAQVQTAPVPQGNVPVPPQPQNPVNSLPATAQSLPPAANAGQYAPPPNPGIPPANPAATAPAPSAIQSASQARLNRYQEDLKTLQQENEIYRNKLEQNRTGTPSGGPIPSPALPRDNSIPGIPASAVSAVPGMPAESKMAAPAGVNTAAAVPGAPSPLQQQQLSPQALEKEVSALAEKIRKEASVAKVVEFDPAWAFLIINGGRDVGIELNMRFAVRRNSEILGWIKITEVEATRAVAQLMSGNKDSQTARKPAPGDDIIAFNLF